MVSENPNNDIQALWQSQEPESAELRLEDVKQIAAAPEKKAPAISNVWPGRVWFGRAAVLQLVFSAANIIVGLSPPLRYVGWLGVIAWSLVARKARTRRKSPGQQTLFDPELVLTSSLERYRKELEFASESGMNLWEILAVVLVIASTPLWANSRSLWTTIAPTVLIVAIWAGGSLASRRSSREFRQELAEIDALMREPTSE